MRNRMNGVQLRLSVTAAHPISAGMQPATPPQTMFCEVRRLRMRL